MCQIRRDFGPWACQVPLPTIAWIFIFVKFYTGHSIRREGERVREETTVDSTALEREERVRQAKTGIITPPGAMVQAIW